MVVCGQKLKNSRKYRGGSIICISKTGDVESEVSNSDNEEARDILLPLLSSQRKPYECQDLSCSSGKPSTYIISLKYPDRFFITTKSVCDDCHQIYASNSTFGQATITSIKKKLFDFSPKPTLSQETIAATSKATPQVLQGDTTKALQVTPSPDTVTRVTQKTEKEGQVTQTQKQVAESRDTTSDRDIDMGDASPLPPTPTTPNLTITVQNDPRNFTIKWGEYDQDKLKQWRDEGFKKLDVPIELANRFHDRYGIHLYKHPEYDQIIQAWKRKDVALCSKEDIFGSDQFKAWAKDGFPYQFIPPHVLGIWKHFLGNRLPNYHSRTLYARDLLVLYNEHREFFTKEQIDAACNLDPPARTSPQPATQGSTSTNNTKTSSSPMTVSFAEAAERANNQMERQARGSPSPIPGSEGIIPPLQRTQCRVTKHDIEGRRPPISDEPYTL